MISLDTGYLNLNYNCLDTTLAGSIGTFVDDKGGTGWRTTQTACGIVIATTTGDLAIQKTTASVYAYTGDIITYTIFYTNSGTSTVTGVTIFDTLATGFTYITGSLSTGFIITGQDMSWDLSGLSA